jgi:hypothetical protein
MPNDLRHTVGCGLAFFGDRPSLLLPSPPNRPLLALVDAEITFETLKDLLYVRTETVFVGQGSFHLNIFAP